MAAVRRILYFADPMCSWCWGFAPALRLLVGACAIADVPVRLCAGGLRAGATKIMDERDRASIRRHWQDVAKATGQPFDFGFFDRKDFVYDTAPACRACVAVRNLAPPATFEYLEAVQRAFYAENEDVTRPEVLASVAGRIGIDHSDFTAVFEAAEVAEATEADFSFAAGLHIPGFPTVLLQDDNRLTLLTSGWQPFDALEHDLRTWLIGQVAE